MDEKAVGARKLQSIGNVLLNKKKQLSAQTEVTRKITNRIHVIRVMNRTLRENWAFEQNYREKRWKAATHIQKVVRGYLTRTALENLLCSQRQAITEKTIKELTIIASSCFENLGDSVLTAVTRIQRSFRKYTLHKQFLHSQRLHRAQLQERQHELSEFLHQGFQVFACKLKVSLMRQERFKRKKLSSIRHKLAFINLRSRWKKQRVEVPMLRKRSLQNRYRASTVFTREILRALHKKTLLNADLYSHLLSNTPSPLLAPIKETAPLQDLMSIEEYSEFQRQRAELIEKRKEGIERARRGYQLASPKLPKYIPIACELALKPIDNNYVQATYSSIRKSPQALPEPPPRERTSRTSCKAPRYMTMTATYFQKLHSTARKRGTRVLQRPRRPSKVQDIALRSFSEGNINRV